MNAVIIVAGGKGLRMGGDIPKQFLPIGGKPVLMHTIDRFLQFDASMQVVLVLPESQQGYWRTLCDEYHFSQPYILANGGETRFHSVKNGLAKVSSAATLIGVHDGVRPFVSNETIQAAYDAAALTEAAVPVVNVVETIRYIVNDNESKTVPRSAYRLVQTPQVFSALLLRAAYEQPYVKECLAGSPQAVAEVFTDDASVVEKYGHPVTLVSGNRENIKITTPFDLVIASALL